MKFISRTITLFPSSPLHFHDSKTVGSLPKWTYATRITWFAYGRGTSGKTPLISLGVTMNNSCFCYWDDSRLLDVYWWVYWYRCKHFTCWGSGIAWGLDFKSIVWAATAIASWLAPLGNRDAKETLQLDIKERIDNPCSALSTCSKGTVLPCGYLAWEKLCPPLPQTTETRLLLFIFCRDRGV